MPRTVAASLLDQGIASFHADVRELALAMVEQALATELARWRATLPTVRTRAPRAARGQQGKRPAKAKAKRGRGRPTRARQRR